jgi:hypothetical protein
VHIKLTKVYSTVIVFSKLAFWYASVGVQSSQCIFCGFLRRDGQGKNSPCPSSLSPYCNRELHSRHTYSGFGYIDLSTCSKSTAVARHLVLGSWNVEGLRCGHHHPSSLLQLTLRPPSPSDQTCHVVLAALLLLQWKRKGVRRVCIKQVKVTDNFISSM